MSLRADDLWTAIDQIAAEHGWTASRLARKAGLDPTTFNRSKRQFGEHDRWPSSSSVAKVLEVTGESFLQFARRVTAVQEARQEPVALDHASPTNGARPMRQAYRPRRATLGEA